jgi:Transposase DDE domain/Transposase domain (DUF772)
MIRIKDHKTRYMFDPFGNLGKKRKKLLEDSWAGIFRDHVRPILPVNLLACHFDENTGRPSNELFSMMGAMILQQMHDLTDEETVSQFAFNIQWHYALDITSHSDNDSYVCPKSIWNIRHIMSSHDLYQPVFEAVADSLAKVFKVDSSLQRLDSIHIFSNMRHLGRIGIFAKTIQKFLTNLKRHHQDLFDALGKEFTDRYLRKEEESIFSMVKPSESSRILQALGNDLFFVIDCFSSHKDVTTMTSFQLMVRLLREQCLVEEDPDSRTKTVMIKPNKEVPSDSMQSPCDPDATYDGHKGKGYQVQVAETYSTDKDKEELSLITYVEVEGAHENDSDALIPYIESTTERELPPEQVLADSAYGGDCNCEKAKELGVEVVSPCTGRPPKTQFGLVDFTFSPDGKVVACPRGNTPLKTKVKKNSFNAIFSYETCGDCDECPARLGGAKTKYLRYSTKDLRIVQRKVFEKTTEFLDKYRFRAGIEATMSQLDRRTGLKQLRVRGMRAVRFCAFLKATGINILRAAAFKCGQNKDDGPIRDLFSAQCTLSSVLHTLIMFVKEQFRFESVINWRNILEVDLKFQF